MSDIYFDLSNIKTPDNISLALKIISEAYKDMRFKVLVNNSVAQTLYERDNLRFANEIYGDYKLLFTDKYDITDKKYYVVRILKSYKKDVSIYLFIMPNDGIDNFQKYYDLFKNSGLIKENFKYGILYPRGENDNSLVSNDVEDENYLGMVEPSEICEKDVNVLFALESVANTFISTLLYTINFINKKNEKPKKTGYFSKVFGNITQSNSSSQEEQVNYLMEDTTILVTEDDETVILFDDDKSYGYYYNLINRVLANLV